MKLLWDAEHGIRPYTPPIRYRRPWKVYTVACSLFLLAGISIGYALHAYQTGVALENVRAMGEGILQAAAHIEHPKRATTKAQAAAIVAEKERMEP